MSSVVTTRQSTAQPAPAKDWHEANQRYLAAALAVVREALEAPAADPQDRTPAPGDSVAPADALQEAACAMSALPALEALCQAFSLSPFERDVLLLCAGIELDSCFAPLCAAAQGDASRTYPTFSLALAVLPGAHWSALTPAAPLRRWRLVEPGSGAALTVSPLRIDERVLHYLAGVQHPDERLAGIVEPVRATGDLVPSHRALAERVVAAWSQAGAGSDLPAAQLCGHDAGLKREVAVAACSFLGLNLRQMAAHAVPSTPPELDALLRLWDREAALASCALLLNCDDLDLSDAPRAAAVTWLLERIQGPLILSVRERRPALQRPVVTFDVRKPGTSEQRALWKRVVEARADLNGEVHSLTAQFSLSPAAIRDACADASVQLMGEDLPPRDLARVLWDACRTQARPRLDDLAHRIEPAAAWDGLVVPDPQRGILREITAHVRQRATVYETWGFAAKGPRGLGISALFAGASGTGKTMAAEVLAGELRLDLYRIDLSQVVSKYIGETEKNLRRVFDAADEGGAILLFDEADALFGKRGEVKDSHDRYANIEISYLLQRMEAYRGLAILTTNMRDALDAAFLRRIRFVVQFPFPDAAQRAEIWRRIFPQQTPVEDLRIEKLARLNVAGGSIRNIALNAAFLAADAGEPVRMKHLLRAARAEYGKLERPLTESETAGWI
jgi:hypothetical protein